MTFTDIDLTDGASVEVYAENAYGRDTAVIEIPPKALPVSLMLKAIA